MLRHFIFSCEVELGLPSPLPCVSRTGGWESPSKELQREHRGGVGSERLALCFPGVRKIDASEFIRLYDVDLGHSQGFWPISAISGGYNAEKIREALLLLISIEFPKATC